MSAFLQILKTIKLDKIVIVNYLNESKIGGIFSEIEGQCIAFGEYLLCGLPIISTFCSGGREVFYNEKNSIMCEANEEYVFEAFKIALKK